MHSLHIWFRCRSGLGTALRKGSRWRAHALEPRLLGSDRTGRSDRLNRNRRLSRFGPCKRSSCKRTVEYPVEPEVFTKNQWFLFNWTKENWLWDWTLHASFPPKEVTTAPLCALCCMLKLNLFERFWSIGSTGQTSELSTPVIRTGPD